MNILGTDALRLLVATAAGPTSREASSMEICTICREGSEPGGRGPVGGALCPACAKLLHWFLGHFDHIESIRREMSITAETTFHELAVDSLDYVEWIMEAEEQFDLTIPEDAAYEMRTIGDYLRFIQSHAKKGQGWKGARRDSLWDRELDG